MQYEITAFFHMKTPEKQWYMEDKKPRVRTMVNLQRHTTSTKKVSRSPVTTLVTNGEVVQELKG